MKILSNKKYKEIIHDRKWALSNLRYNENKVIQMQHDIETLLFDNSNLRNLNLKLKEKIKELEEKIGGSIFNENVE